MSSSGWTKFETKFINLIKTKYQCIYQLHWRSLSNRKTLKKYWFEIANNFGNVTANQCQAKWSAILKRYVSLKRPLNSGEKPVESFSKYIESKYLDGTLDFLDEHLLHKKSFLVPNELDQWKPNEKIFIHLLKHKFQIVYDKSSKNASCKNVWPEMAAHFKDMTAKNCRNKWKTIRDRYLKVKKPIIMGDFDGIIPYSKYLDGSLDFLDEFLFRDKKYIEKRKCDKDAVSGDDETLDTNSNSSVSFENKTSDTMNSVPHVSTENSKNKDNDLNGSSCVTLDTIHTLLSQKEDDSPHSVCVTQDLVQNLLKTKNSHLNIVSDEPVWKIVGDKLKDALEDMVSQIKKPTKSKTVRGKSTTETNKGKNNNSNTCVMQRELTQAVINSMLNSNGSVPKGALNDLDTEPSCSKNNTPTYLARVDDISAAVTLPPKIVPKNGMLEIDSAKTASKRKKNDGAEVPRKKHNKNCVKIDENNVLNIVDNEEMDIKKFFSDLGAYVEKRFPVENLKKLRLQIVSLITQAELDMLEKEG